MDKDSIGPCGEQIAAKFLEAEGWQVTAMNFRNRIGELDIVAERWKARGDGYVRIIAFVEVKTRRYRKNSPPSANVTYRKRRKIVVLARSFLKLHKIRNARCRFDVITVLWRDDGRHIVTHYPRAFDARGRG